MAGTSTDTPLDASGREVRLAREALEAALERSRVLALEALAAGTPEAQVARRAGVDRQTVRRWAGKGRPV